MEGAASAAASSTSSKGSSPFASDGLRSLSQVLNLYPTQWSAASRRILLMDVAVLGKESNAADLAFRVHRVKENLLLPLARIILCEKEAVRTEKEKLDVNEQQLHAAVDLLATEKRSLIQQVNDANEQLAQQSMFIEALLEEMTTISNQHKAVIEQLQHIILVKDLEIQKLLADSKQELSQPKPDEDAETFRDAGVKDEWPSSAEEDFAFLNRSSSASSNRSTLSNLSSNSVIEAKPLQQNMKKPESKAASRKNSGLIEVVISEVWLEGISSLRIVEERGICSVPSAVVHFWFAVASHVISRVAEMLVLRMRQGFCCQI